MMGFTRNSLKGVTYYDPVKAFNGYTLFTPLGSRESLLIDMRGRIVQRWKLPYKPALYGKLLPNGNLLYSGHIEDGPLSDLIGAGGELIEVDWSGNIVWNYRDLYIHHAFSRLPNGNTVVIKWVPVPEDIANRVEGGIKDSERAGIMWGDCFQEINLRGKVVWEWFSYEHLDPETDALCPLCPRIHWPGSNSCTIFPNGDILTSFMQTNTICIIDKITGNIQWRWGSSGELGHQNDATILQNGNILVFDNGTHTTGISESYSRVLEIDKTTEKMVWEYKDNPWFAFYSAYLSSCQRLPNGNTLICEAIAGRIFEITEKGELVWEFVNQFSALDPVFGNNNIVPKAERYEPEYEGLMGKNLVYST